MLTGRDLPIPYGILPVSQDEHALCIDKVRFIGDPVAAVRARRGDRLRRDEPDRSRIRAAQDRSPPRRGADDPDEPRIHDYGDGGNIHKKVSLEFGDVEKAFAEADLYSKTPSSTKATPTCRWSNTRRSPHFDSDEKLTLWSSTQTPHYVHRALAKVLEMPASHIRVIATPNGGGFGGKSDPFNHEVVVAKAA